MATPPFRKIFGVPVRTVPGNTVSNLKSVALTVLELLAFNAKKFRGHVSLATPISGTAHKIFSLGC